MRKCRLCEKDKYTDVLNMGPNPLVNSLIEKEDLAGKQETFPLKVVRCSGCGLVQNEKPIPAEKIYTDQDYLYYSSDMPGLEEYFSEYVKEISDNYLGVGNSDFVVEIGSNDGVMLKQFQEVGHKVLGVDPSANVVVRALKNGIPTLPLFFTHRLARNIRDEYGPARVIYGNNCIAHIDDLNDVMRGVQTLLDKDGIFVVECNYWGGMVDNTNYALVYHDHFSYFSLKNWQEYGSMWGLTVFDAVVTPAQGGSLRVYMSNGFREPTSRLKLLQSKEEQEGYNTKEVAESYGKRCKAEAKKLRETVEECCKEGVVAGYGAAAKGFSVLKLAGVTGKHLKYFVDDSPAKQGKYTPVTHIPIYARDQVEDPDYFFITAPNYSDVIIKKERSRGYKGKFILCDSTIV